MKDFHCHVRTAAEPGTPVGGHLREAADGAALIDAKLPVADAGYPAARLAAGSREPAEGSGR